MNSSASNLPGPHAARTFFTVATLVWSRWATGLRFGDRDTMGPTWRAGFAQPSSRCPMPGAKELSTVEWHSAHSMPTERRVPLEAKMPLTPTTEFSLSSARVTAGSSRFTLPALMAERTALGSLVTSTLRPTPSAVFGLTPGPTPPLALPARARLRCRVPPQKAWSPKVSNRKVRRPWSTSRLAWWSTEAGDWWGPPAAGRWGGGGGARGRRLVGRSGGRLVAEGDDAAEGDDPQRDDGPAAPRRTLVLELLCGGGL